jgi:hypothetical protein
MGLTVQLAETLSCDYTYSRVTAPLKMRTLAHKHANLSVILCKEPIVIKQGTLGVRANDVEYIAIWAKGWGTKALLLEKRYRTNESCKEIQKHQLVVADSSQAMLVEETFEVGVSTYQYQ